MTDRATIFALSSGRPPAAIAVIRISGTRAGAALTALGVKIPEPRKAALARIRDCDNEIIDEALVLWFPGPNSETGEDTAELQIHGGPAVIAGVLDALGRIEGLRPAEAGEFTRRAFENGKLDLTAVEGLADLVSAETQGQRRQAFRQMKGLLGNRAETWRQRLIQALALVEARIDFSDEADVPEELVAPALAIARELAGEIEAALADGRRGERIREGLVVAIAGPPNAGKSTLLNLLARREAAIVSPYAGTTRDVIEVHLDLGGMAVTLLDTAGIRETEDPVELEGVRRARERAAGADLVLWVVDASQLDGGRPMADGSTEDLGVAAAFAASVSPGDEAAGGARASGVEFVAPGAPAQTFGLPSRQISPANWRARVDGEDAVDGSASLPFTAVRPSARQQPVWLIRNKVDLIRSKAVLVQGDSGGLSPPQAPLQKNELKNQFNIPLIDMVNQSFRPKGEPTVSKSELINRINKSRTSMVNPRLRHKSELDFSKNEFIFDLSTVSGEGFDELLSDLWRFAAAFMGAGESSLVTRARHRHILEETLAALNRALAPGLGGHEDLVAEELRAATAALGRLTGRVDVEDIFDVIFRDFCIGK